MQRLIRIFLYASLLFLIAFSSLLFAQDDEFGEFNELDAKEFNNDLETPDPDSTQPSVSHRGLYFAITALLFTAIAGILIRFKLTRKLRYIFLLTSLIILGFYRGGCPCMISGFHDFWFWIFGQDVKIHKVLWFLGLIPLTYIFGRVWCGWICHLGALQEFLYKENRSKFLKSHSFQKGLKLAQYFFFIVLMLQIFITKSNIFIHYDPFKVAFNLFSANITGYILLIILLLTSLFINRPFCRGVCPIGLVLGWMSKIPGALKIGKNIECNSYHLCEGNCPTQAIDADLNFISEDCIVCGNCFDSCKKDAVCCERTNINEK